MSESFLDAVKQRRVDLSFSLLMSNERALHVLQHAAEAHIIKVFEAVEDGNKDIFGDKEREELKSTLSTLFQRWQQVSAWPPGSSDRP